MPADLDVTSLLHASFTLVFIAFSACAFFLYMERDRVPERYRTAIRLSTVYVAIAAVNYWFMKDSFVATGASGTHVFPTHYRYIDWVLTTPLMLLEFPLLLGVGEKGKNFMFRLVALDLLMIAAGYFGELTPGMPALHYGLFLVGCVAWLAILVQLFAALSDLPDNLPDSVRRGVRTMGVFVVAGWAVYPLGYFCPLLGLPGEARELVYNAADLGNKVGLCLIVYFAARNAASSEGVAEASEDVVGDEGAHTGATLPVAAE